MKKTLAIAIGLMFALNPITSNAAEEMSGPGVTAEYEFRVEAQDPTPPVAVAQRTLATFPAAASNLSSLQQSQVRAALTANPDADKFICTGIRQVGQPASANVEVRKRAKAACDYAKSLNPNLSTWFQSKQTTAASFNGRVLLTVKTEQTVIDTYATCEKGVNERVLGSKGTSGNYICAELVYSLSDPTKVEAVDITVRDKTGKECVPFVNPDCTGYYIGWRMNFDDSDRQVNYQGTTRISGLKAGDAGYFQLMYEPTPQVVSASIQLVSANGAICNPDFMSCGGYYIGWAMNFNDSDRKVDYSGPTVISNLVAGDKGQFLLMYQKDQASMPIRAAGYEFSYDPGKSIVPCGDKSLETVLDSAVGTGGYYLCVTLSASRP
jgi:hypothetical protein